VKRIATAVLLLFAVSPSAALELGAPIPLAEHAMADVGGRRWSVGEVCGERGTVVMFICVHCPWVQKWNARIADLGRRARAAGIGVIAVNANDPSRAPQDGPAGMRSQIDANGFDFPYVIDSGSTLTRAYGAQRTPEVYLFDAAGALAYHGTIDDDADDPKRVEQHFLRDAIAAVAASKQPDPRETKALGCTIKMYPEAD
jgi:hypothetical protein